MTKILITDFVSVLLISLRVIAVLYSAPFFDSRFIPGSAKVFIGIITAYMIFMIFGPKVKVTEVEFIPLAVLAVKEMITGLIIGFSVNFIFYAINFAGMLIGTDMQLNMASVFNVMEESNSNVIGDLLYYFAVMVFFLINGHHYIIESIAYSFKIIPLGKYTINEASFSILVSQSVVIFILAIKIAAPIMVSFFLITVAESIISRIVPQMQVFFVTQPLKIVLGFIFLMTFVPFFIIFVSGVMSGIQGSLLTLINAMGQ